MTSRREILQRGTPLARALPGAQFSEGHHRIFDAEPDRVWAALHDLTWGELRLSRPLMAVRSVGAGRGRGPRPPDPARRMVDPPSPAVPLFEDPPRVSTSGMIGRPWTRTPLQGPQPADLDELRDFDRPGWLKYGMEWVLSPVAGGRTLVETITLCEATDRQAFRRFAAYWVVIRGFSGLIRRDILAALARRVVTSG